MITYTNVIGSVDTFNSVFIPSAPILKAGLTPQLGWLDDEGWADAELWYDDPSNT